MPPNPHRRAEDNSVSAWLRDKVLPPLIVATCLSCMTLAFAMYRMVSNHDMRIALIEQQITVMRAQMVGWDTVARMERSLAALSAAGNGDKAMAAMASVLRNEVETRKETTK